MAGYAKLWSGITKSSLWGADLAVRVLFVSMMAEADSTGFIETSIPGLARMASLTREQTEAALAVLMAPDPDSKSAEADGRRVAKVEMGYALVNYEVYRERQDDAAKRERNRLYMREYRTGNAEAIENTKGDDGCKTPVRACKSQNLTVSDCKSPSSKVAQAEAEAEAEADQKEPSPVSPGDVFDFEAVYALYPRKEGRKKGLARCRSSVKTRLKYDALLLAVKNYAATVTDVQFAKHFDTFMNCWEDYVDAGLLTPRTESRNELRRGNTAPTANFAKAGIVTGEFT